MDTSAMYSREYQQNSQQPSPSGQQQQQQWLQPIQTTSPYASPTATSPGLADPSYANIFHPGSRGGSDGSGGGANGGNGIPRTPSSLSLNMSGLSVASPSLSPGVQQGGAAGSVNSPITPITPAQQGGGGHLTPQTQPAIFRYTPPDPTNPAYDPTPPPNANVLYPGSGGLSPRPRSSGDKSPRKRTAASLSLSVDIGGSSAQSINHNMYDNQSHSQNHTPNTGNPSPMELPHLYPADDGFGPGAESSPMEESPTSTGFPEDMSQGMGGGGMGMNITKPIGSTNNFVSKLYQMISDPKSTRFINWTEHGTSFVVSNVGEFSRSILGAHFKHNNFSSFVRQLNMYGFSKINRTPRAQRASSDGQTWEFAHTKFLRGRPDLLDEIRRKALEPDPSLKQRVELPGELAAQLNQIRDENRRVVRALEEERERASGLARAVKSLYDVIGKAFPGEMLMGFPMELLDGGDNPPIFITSPASNSTHYPTAGGSVDSLYAMHSLSPTSSPTTSDFPHLSPQRGLSLPHITTLPTYDQQHQQQQQQQHQHQQMTPTHTQNQNQNHVRLGSLSSNRGYGDAPSSPSPLNTPISGPEDEGAFRVKRQRTTPSPMPPHAHQHHQHNQHITRRARSDSAPLGAGGGHASLNTTWGQVRPRSGSGLGLVGGVGPPQHSGITYPAGSANLPLPQLLPHLTGPGIKDESRPLEQ